VTGLVRHPAAWAGDAGKILPFVADFEGFFTLKTPVDFVVFSRVCPVGHSFLVRKVYKWGQNRDCVVGRRR
jgi:hypothetical protein